jgi:hypothetical protein
MTDIKNIIITMITHLNNISLINNNDNLYKHNKFVFYRNSKDG